MSVSAGPGGDLLLPEISFRKIYLTWEVVLKQVGGPGERAWPMPTFCGPILAPKIVVGCMAVMNWI